MMIYVNMPKYVAAKQLATFSTFTGVVAAVKPLPKTLKVEDTQIHMNREFEQSLRAAIAQRRLDNSQLDVKAQFNALFSTEVK